MKQVTFSRHSQRRMKLYGIEVIDIYNALEFGINRILDDGKTSYIYEIDKLKYPLKVECEQRETNVFIITCYPVKKDFNMKISYDEEADALYIEISAKKPSGVVEVKEGVNIDVDEEGKIVGLEFLDASKKVPLESFLSYEISPDFVKKAI